MDCETYNALLIDYKRACLRLQECCAEYSRYKRGFHLAVAEADRLKQYCTEASDTLMEHWREHHGNVAAKSGS